jgi:transposase
MRFVAIKTPEQMDLLALHRVRSRRVRLRTGVINQIRGFLIERGIAVRQGPAPLSRALSDLLGSTSAALSPRLVRLIADLAEDWRRLNDRIATVSAEIEALAKQNGLPDAAKRLGAMMARSARAPPQRSNTLLQLSRSTISDLCLATHGRTIHHGTRQ